MRSEIPTLVLGVLLIIAGLLVTIFEPNIISSTSGAMGGLIGAGVAAILIAARGLWQQKKQEITEDERDYKIAEKATFKVFQVMFPVIGFSFATLSFINWELSARPVLGVLFALMGVLYAGFNFRYKRRI